MLLNLKSTKHVLKLRYQKYLTFWGALNIIFLPYNLMIVILILKITE